MRYQKFFYLSTAYESQVRLLYSSYQHSGKYHPPARSEYLHQTSLSTDQDLLSPRRFLVQVQSAVRLDRIS